MDPTTRYSYSYEYLLQVLFSVVLVLVTHRVLQTTAQSKYTSCPTGLMSYPACPVQRLQCSYEYPANNVSHHPIDNVP
eukprot:scaffold410564_cov13-Prasinocladus_malaysianus.AAC.1